MRRDRQRLDDILEALDSLARIIQGSDEAGFLSDEVVRYAVVQRLTVVGGAAAAGSAVNSGSAIRRFPGRTSWPFETWPSMNTSEFIGRSSG